MTPRARKTTKQDDVQAILAECVGDEIAADIIAHRKGKKCPLTATGARRLVKEYEKTGNPREAAEEHLNRGWQGFKADWIAPKSQSRFRDYHNPSPAANYGNPAPVEKSEPISEEERQRRAEMARKASAVIRGAVNGLTH